MPKKPSTAHTSLSKDLELLRQSTCAEGISIGELENMLRGRGFEMLILLCSLPFAAPIPIPGLSIPFGIMIALLGFRLMLGRRPWLPKFILNKKISQKILIHILDIGSRFAGWLEKIATPRLRGVSRWHWIRHLTGVAIFFEGIALAMPPPMMNFIPAWGLLFLTAGVLEQDGLLVLIGHVLAILTLLYALLLFYLGKIGLEWFFSFF